MSWRRRASGLWAPPPLDWRVDPNDAFSAHLKSCFVPAHDAGRSELNSRAPEADPTPAAFAGTALPTWNTGPLGACVMSAAASTNTGARRSATALPVLTTNADSTLASGEQITVAALVEMTALPTASTFIYSLRGGTSLAATTAPEIYLFVTATNFGGGVSSDFTNYQEASVSAPPARVPAICIFTTRGTTDAQFWLFRPDAAPVTATSSATRGTFGANVAMRNEGVLSIPDGNANGFNGRIYGVWLWQRGFTDDDASGFAHSPFGMFAPAKYPRRSTPTVSKSFSDTVSETFTLDAGADATVVPADPATTANGPVLIGGHDAIRITGPYPIGAFTNIGALTLTANNPAQGYTRNTNPGTMWAIQGGSNLAVTRDVTSADIGTSYTVQIGYTDSLSNIGADDVVVYFDPQGAQTYNDTVSDSFALGDGATAANTLTAAAASNPITLGDGSAVTATANAAVASNPVTLGDGAAATQAHAASVSDSFALGSDAAATVIRVYSDTVSDSFALGDGAGAAATFAPSADNPLSITAGADGATTLGVSTSDSLALGSGAAAGLAQTDSVSDTISLGSGAVATLIQTVSVTDSPTLGSGAGAQASITASVSDSYTLTDATSAALSALAPVSDTLTAGSGADAQATFLAAVSDAITFDANADSYKGGIELVSDTITLGGGAGAQATAVPAAADSFTLGTGSAATLTTAAQASDSLALGAGAAAAQVHNVSTSDAISLGAGADYTSGATVSASDSLTLGSGAAATVIHNAAATDSITLDAGASNRADLAASAFEAFALGGGADALQDHAEAVSDAFALGADAFGSRVLFAETFDGFTLGADAASTLIDAPLFGVVGTMGFRQLTFGEMAWRVTADGIMPMPPRRLTDGTIMFEGEA